MMKTSIRDLDKDSFVGSMKSGLIIRRSSSVDLEKDSSLDSKTGALLHRLTAETRISTLYKEAKRTITRGASARDTVKDSRRDTRTFLDKQRISNKQNVDRPR